MIAKRRWVCVLSDNTTTGTETTFAQVTTATGTSTFGVQHPDLTSWKLRKVWINEGYEGSPYHVEVVAEYGTVRDEEALTPISRPAVWNFEGGQGEVPALFYYDGTGNSTKYPLTNSAFDFFPGLMTEESVVRATVQKNFGSFPSEWYEANNHVNDAEYLGCLAHTLKVAGVNVSYEYEDFGGAMISYWKATATLVYRQSGHNLLLPDIGFNFISGVQKQRATVFDFQNDQWVPSPNPVALNGTGGVAAGAPAILNRRVFPESDFFDLFGTPPS